MSKKKRMGLRYFILSFLITFSVVTVIAFLALMQVLNPAPAQSITEKVPKIEHSFSESDSITVLVTGYSRKQPQTAYYSLVRLDAPNQRVLVTSLPAETVISDQEGQSTLTEIAAYSGSSALTAKLSEALNVEIDRYLRIEETAFSDLVDSFGAVTYVCPKRVEYYDQNGFLAYSMSEGKHVFFGEKLCGLIKYSGSNSAERANEQSKILCELFSQRISSGAYTDIQAVFEELIGSCESSINAFDFEARRAALEQIVKDKDIRFTTIEFVPTDDNTLNEEYLKSLSVYR